MAHATRPAHDASHDGGHIIPFKVYASVLAALLVLTVVTVLASLVNFGAFNIIIAMLIASVKAGIVALFFMHLKYENPLIWLYVLFPVLLLLLLLGGLFIDTPLRNDPTGRPTAATAAQEQAPRGASHNTVTRGSH